MIKSNVEKLTQGVVGFFDNERLKGFFLYDNNLVIDISSLLNDSLKLFNKYSKHKNIELTDCLECNLSVKADPQAITRILNNLADNALKYTDEGGRIDVGLNSIGETYILP
jgi:signal transduction histidine kinase